MQDGTFESRQSASVVLATQRVKDCHEKILTEGWRRGGFLRLPGRWPRVKIAVARAVQGEPFVAFVSARWPYQKSIYGGRCCRPLSEDHWK